MVDTNSLNFCEICNKPIYYIGKYSSGRFCSRGCANKYSSYTIDKTKTKSSICIICGKKIQIKLRASNKCTCDECRKTCKLKPCKMCGAITRKKCKHPDICSHYQLIPTLINYFGFNKELIGTERVYSEYDRIRQILYNDYNNNLLSLTDIVIKYNFKANTNRSLCKLAADLYSQVFKKLKINTRTISEAVHLIKMLKPINNIVTSVNYKYKHGYHITWNNKQVYYRSSYELKYMKELDEQRVNYEVEFLRIKYFDTQKNKYRVAIPDFYLPEINEIIEIKSYHTYIPINMKDKFKAYRELGYNCKCILEFKEVII